MTKYFSFLAVVFLSSPAFGQGGMVEPLPECWEPSLITCWQAYTEQMHEQGAIEYVEATIEGIEPCEIKSCEGPGTNRKCEIDGEYISLELPNEEEESVDKVAYGDSNNARRGHHQTSISTYQCAEIYYCTCDDPDQEDCGHSPVDPWFPEETKPDPEGETCWSEL